MRIVVVRINRNKSGQMTSNGHMWFEMNCNTNKLLPCGP
jgi:hypothetical protein